MTDFAERASEDPDGVFDAFLAARLSGEQVDWERVRDAHPDLRDALDERYEDLLRGEAIVARLGEATAREIPHDATRREAAVAALLADLRRPRDADPYRVLGVLARGGMAIIERVWDGRLQRLLARKVLPLDVRSDLGARERQRVGRFLDEALVLSRMQHPGILAIHDVGVDAGGRLYFTMPIVRGHDLGAAIRQAHEQTGGWTLFRVLDTVTSICGTVAYAHSKGVVHRDLKPQNVMVGRYGEVFVMDWGLAAVQRGDAGGGSSRGTEASSVSIAIDRLRAEVGGAAALLATGDGEIVGTPAYMAPEQATGGPESASAAADQYAIGAILYEAATGCRPYEDSGTARSAAEAVDLVRRGPPTPVSVLAPTSPPELVAIIERATARNPADRYPSVGDLVQDLLAFREQRVVKAYPTGVLARMRKWARRNAGLAASLAVGVGLLALAFAVFLRTEATFRSELEASNRRLVAEQTVSSSRVEDLRAALYAADISKVQQLLTDPKESHTAAGILDACDPDLRRWEWLLLRRRCDPSTRQLAAAQDGNGLAVSADGRLIAHPIQDFDVVVSEAATGRISHRLACRGFVDALAFSADGSALACWARDHVLRILDLRSGELRSFPARAKTYSNFVALSPDARHVVMQRSGTEAAVYEVATGEVVAGITDVRVDLVAFEDPGVLWFAGIDGTVHGFETEGWTRVASHRVATGPITAFRHRPESGTALVFEGRRGLVSEVDLKSGAVVPKATLAPSNARGVFDPEGTRLAFGRGAGIRIDELATAISASLPGHEHDVVGLAFAPKGRLVSLAPRDSVRIWECAGGETSGEAGTRVDADPSLPVSPARGSGGFRCLARLKGPIGDLSIAADGRSFLAAVRDRVVEVDLRTGAGRSVVTGLGQFVGRVRRHPVRAEAALVGQARRIALLDLGTFEISATFEVEVGSARAMAWTPDGSRLLVAGDRSSWRNGGLFDLAPNGGCRPFTAPAIPADAAFSDDGRRFATGGEDGAVHVFDAASCELAGSVSLGVRLLQAVAWSKDGQWIAAGGSTAYRSWGVFLIDARTLQVEAVLVGHRNACTSLAFTPDGRLVSASDDGTIRVFDVERRRLLLTLGLDDGEIPKTMALSGDGRVLVVGTRTGVLYALER